MFKKEGTVALRKIGTKYSIFFNKRITIYYIDFLLCDSPVFHSELYAKA